jgi:hypothetical protein
MQRTDWAEEFFERFSSIPLTAEFVFLRPHCIDRGKYKEVCDLLIVLKGKAFLISMKAQQNPLSRSDEKLKLWTINNAFKAFAQAKGAINTIENKSFWCQHSRRGRVDFNPGEIDVIHVIVLTELFNNVVQLPDNNSLLINNVPVTYMSLNDFLNIINDLRTFPDISAYLNERRKLNPKYQLIIGDEKSLYKYYILKSESFNDWDIDLNEIQNSEWQLIQSKRELNKKDAGLIEFVSDSLATRMPNYLNGLEYELIKGFDEQNNRKNYLLIQEELCDLRFYERVALGVQFKRVIEKIKDNGSTESMAYNAFHTDSKPDFVYVLISSKGVDRNELIDRSSILIYSAMKKYNKVKGLVIADRDSIGFEVQLVSAQNNLMDNKDIKTSYFDHLQMTESLCQKKHGTEEIQNF